MAREKVIHIHRLPPDRAARVLIAALPNATDAERMLFLRELLCFDNPSAIRAGLTSLSELRPRDQVHTLKQPLPRQGISRALSHGLQLNQLQCDGLLSLIETQPHVNWLPVLADLILHHDDVDIPRAAACMLSIVINRCGPHGLQAISPGEDELIDLAVSRTLHGWRAHRAADVALLGAILAHQPGPCLRDLLNDPTADCHTALRSTVSQTGRMLVRSNLLRWLVHPQLGRAALRWLNSMADRDARAWDDVLSQGHLLRLPAYRRVLRQVDRPARCVPHAGQWGRLAPASQRWLPIYLASLGLTPRLRRQYLVQCTSLPHPTGRLALLRVLDEIGHGARDEVARLLVRDRDPAVARLAAAMLINRMQDDPEIASLLTNCPHESVRRFSTRFMPLQPPGNLRTMESGNAEAQVVVVAGPRQYTEAASSTST